MKKKYVKSLVLIISSFCIVVSCIGVWNHYEFDGERFRAVLSIHGKQYYAEMANDDISADACYMVREFSFSKFLSKIEQDYDVKLADQMGGFYLLRGDDGRLVTVTHELFFRFYGISYVYVKNDTSP